MLWRWWPFSRKLSSALLPEKKVRVHGVVFTIRKLSPIDHLAGAKTLRRSFETYRTSNPETAEDVSGKQLKAHYVDVFMSGVVAPRLTRKADDKDASAILVDNLFSDWDLAAALYSEIIEFTYGKKKVARYLSRATA